MFQVTVLIKKTILLDIGASDDEEAKEAVYNMSHTELDEYIQDTDADVEIERTVTEVRNVD